MELFRNTYNIRTMVKVAFVEFQKNIGRYQDLALTEPVMVTRNGREGTVLLSAAEYERLTRRDRRVMGLEDFTAEDIAAIERAEPLPECARYDHEVED